MTDRGGYQDVSGRDGPRFTVIPATLPSGARRIGLPGGMKGWAVFDTAEKRLAARSGRRTQDAAQNVADRLNREDEGL